MYPGRLWQNEFNLVCMIMNLQGVSEQPQSFKSHILYHDDDDYYYYYNYFCTSYCPKPRGVYRIRFVPVRYPNDLIISELLFTRSRCHDDKQKKIKLMPPMGVCPRCYR